MTQTILQVGPAFIYFNSTNLKLLKFKFQCPKQWEGLTEGDNPAIRFCATCRRNVDLCMSDEEVGRHAAQGHCVVIGFTEDTGFCGLMGEIADDWTDAPVEVCVGCRTNNWRRAWIEVQRCPQVAKNKSDSAVLVPLVGLRACGPPCELI